ncbi:MAG: hypothetical protein M0R17_05815 [Candidatus Omnitrophica bacterium]|jgi:hypothetical protein|nr:hypothetical protein [Candidatus Omnitrophota bacterium]
MFENLKQKLMEKIEKNSCEANLTYKDIEGVEHTELVRMKKSLTPLGDWHRIYVPIDPETNKWNVPNALFGGKKNMFKLIGWLILAGLFFLAFKEIGSNYEALANLPCVKNCLLNLNLK